MSGDAGIGAAAGIGGGFIGAKKGLGAIGDQTKWMNEQVGAGKLSLEPGAAEAAAKHCEEEIQELAKVLSKADQIAYVQGLGNYQSGQDLMKAFQDKATAPGAGAQDLIREMQEKLQEQADAFRAAAKDYQDTDDQIANDMQRGMRQ